MPSPSELARQDEEAFEAVSAWTPEERARAGSPKPPTSGGRFGPGFQADTACLKPLPTGLGDVSLMEVRTDTEDLGQPGALEEPFDTAWNSQVPKAPTGPWNTKDLLAHHAHLTAKARELMVRKNHDYAGASGKSPFANFETSEALGLVSTEQGIMVRLLDKVKRLCTFLEAGEYKVEDEKVEDTVLDLINYTVILSGYLAQKGSKA